MIQQLITGMENNFPGVAISAQPYGLHTYIVNASQKRTEVADYADRLFHEISDCRYPVTYNYGTMQTELAGMVDGIFYKIHIPWHDKESKKEEHIEEHVLCVSEEEH